MGAPIPNAFGPHQLMLCVLSDDGHLLTDLFVLYRPAPPPPAEDTRSWFERYLWADDPEPPPRVPFEVGHIDAYGYLGDVPGAHGPVTVSCTPKLAMGVPYQMYFVRHPDPQYAIAAAAELNGGAPVKLTEGWGDPTEHTPTVGNTPMPMVDETAEDGFKRLELRLPSTPETYHPRGADRFGGWVLYRGMPHASVPAVQQAVTRAQQDLGKLRYIVGGQAAPYAPETSGEYKNAGVFDARLLNAVLMLQRDTLGGTAFQVADKSRAHDAPTDNAHVVASSWAFLEGQSVRVTAPAARQNERDFRADGVLDAMTTRLLDDWLARGLRRPGHILVAICASPGSTSWIEWLRDDGAESFEAWRELTVALGFSSSVRVGHTYRHPLKHVGHAPYATSPVSNHKSGLAIDLRMKNHQPLHEGSLAWPIWYSMVERQPLANGFKAGWRLYGTSTFDADPVAAATTIRDNLTPLAARGGVLGRAAGELLSALGTPDTFFASYFPTQITPWQYDDYHEDGGVELPVMAPPAPATRFLDLTRVAAHCLLKPIHSGKNLDRTSRNSWGVVTCSVTPNRIDRVAALAKALQKAHNESNAPFAMTVDGTAVQLATVDADFIASYADTLKAIVNDRGLRGAHQITGAKLVIKLGASSQRQTQLETLAQKLEALGSDRLATGGVEIGDVRTGAEWAAWLREQVAALVSPALATDGSTEARAKPPSEVTLWPIIAESEGHPLRLLDNHNIEYPKPGDPTGMEWWHFQRTDLVNAARTFGVLLGELGWSTEGLLNTPSAVTYGRTGLGYPQTELDKRIY